MATDGSIAGRDLFDSLNIEYEHAYRNNPFKKNLIKHCISLLEPGSRVLDVGCGTGVPVSQMLADAGMEVEGFDIAPKMVELASNRVPKGKFEATDMLEYQPKGHFAGIFIIYSHLQLDYSSFHSATFKLAKALKVGGIVAIGQSPTDTRVPKDDPAFDETQSYVEAFNLPFWGEPLDTFMMSRAGQKEFLTSMGLEIVYETVDDFQPDNPKCGVETQQYVVGRRPNDAPLSPPKPLPNAH
ncbi:hypothetical protein LTR36_007632 [Oleoguttula mirabilis]|uniref:Methyltransferase domain-containing protein n=1 Tax=Oleoguttula mirabilis TaxID=1507867 RepID=A0AAV9JUG2_9PEZI|nr:hypothetical protein LTR36_007632 [Oleoguttula mirabilis]